MKRKIAAIMAADIAGYSRLVAEDEEETLRRLAAYRAVVDDFIAKSSGRIFSTAGDAVLAEFSSAVEAVRCAIDIQESLRTRNRAYPPSRQMNFRIGITIGDVVERDGDLLGDGVNIAARLEGIAPVGGICVSRNVFEQVANKLSVRFADIGEQQVKNIPSPVHAFTVAMHGEAVAPPPAAGRLARSRWPLLAALGGAAAAALAAALYLAAPPVDKPTVIATAPPPASQPPASAPPQASTPAAPSAPAAPAAPAPSAASAPAAPPSALPAPPPRQPERLIAERVPAISDRARIVIRNNYVTAPGYKALAVSPRQIGFLTGQPDDETAREGALASCQRATDAIPGPPFRCELFAVGDFVVSPRGHPPLPPEPWLISDPAIERPFVLTDLPLALPNARNAITQRYVSGPTPKALALAPSGHIGFYVNQANQLEAARRALEYCGMNAGIPCAIVAVDNVFVVPIPTTMKPVGFFNAAADPAIAEEARADVARRLSDSFGGWKAVAVGARGQPGVALSARNERDVTAAALADCAMRDQDCHVVAIGMFSVEAK